MHEAQNHRSLPPFAIALPPWNSVLNLAECYLRYCDSQPLPLFHCDSFCSTFKDRDLEIIYSVLALASRYSSEPLIQQTALRDRLRYAQAAHQLVMNRILEGLVELSTMQTLCILSIVELNGLPLQST